MCGVVCSYFLSTFSEERIIRFYDTHFVEELKIRPEQSL
jgi:hypothetical protein